MTEPFLHYLWLYRIYNPELRLVTGEKLDVLKPGEHNRDAGPDFFNARIKIGDTIWAGNIEIHINASDWKKHNHQTNKTYSNIILHVVWNNDQTILQPDGTPFPTLELKTFAPDATWEKYQSFLASQKWIPCAATILQVHPLIRNSWLERLLVERLERKANDILKLFSNTGNDWNLTFYRVLAANMGFNLNKQVFEQLSQSLPYEYLLKHADQLFQVEAMIFGQAGLLAQDFIDEYPSRLKKEYLFLKHKFSLAPINGSLWRFMRIHPGNFPTLRLAQFAAIMHAARAQMGAMLDMPDIKTLRALFDVKASEYWETRYLFDKYSTKKAKKLGKSSVDLLLINLTAPLLTAYGLYKKDTAYTAKAIEILEQVKSEDNSIIRKWAELGIEAKNAGNSQALLQLKTEYCQQKRCLDCRIGVNLLKS